MSPASPAPRGKPAAGTLNADPIPTTMNRTASYSILILRSPQGYQAYAPAFPDIAVHSRSTRVAYARLKALIKQRLSDLLSRAEPIPADPVFQSRTLRIDLWLLSMKEDLV